MTSGQVHPLTALVEGSHHRFRSRHGHFADSQTATCAAPAAEGMPRVGLFSQCDHGACFEIVAASRSALDPARRTLHRAGSRARLGDGQRISDGKRSLHQVGRIHRHRA